MTWEKFLDANIANNYNMQVLTDIECPQCGRKVYLDSSLILTTYPSKYHYWCSCGWEGFAPKKWLEGELDG